MRKSMLFGGVIIFSLLLVLNICSANNENIKISTLKISTQAIPNNNTLRIKNNQLIWQTQGGIGVYNLLNGTKQFIRTNGNFPKLDGNYLAYSKDIDEQPSVELCIYNLQTKEEKKVYLSPKANCFPSFDFCNSRLVWYEGGPYLGVYNLVNNKKVKLSLFPKGYQPSCNNFLDIYLNDNWLVFSYFFEGELTACVYNFSNEEKQIIKGVISPRISGNNLVYQRESKLLSGEVSRDVFIYDLANKQEIKVSNGSKTGAVAVDDGQVAWEEINSIKIVDLNSKQETQLPIKEPIMVDSELVLCQNRLAYTNSLEGKRYFNLNLVELTYPQEP